ncbi:MAG: hypothetical protein PHP08_00055 [Candidatus Dojkabacteria bacterium]|nr:hypothetical protein [Candidatus Dojkabacteria bacterium]
MKTELLTLKQAINIIKKRKTDIDKEHEIRLYIVAFTLALLSYIIIKYHNMSNPIELSYTPFAIGIALLIILIYKGMI